MSSAHSTKSLIHRERPPGAMRGKLAVGRSTVLSLLCGAVFGFSLSYFLFASSEQLGRWNPYTGRVAGGDPDEVAGFNFNLGDIPAYLKQLPLAKDGPREDVVVDHGDHDHGSGDVAADLATRVRVLCWVMTQPKSHQTKARHVKATWGRRCNYLLFMSSEADLTLPAIRLKVSEGRDALWSKTKEAFKYVHQHYLDKVDWVLKADDDTYVVVENLRYVLSQHNASEGVYLGCQFKPYVKQGYMSGGAGYVLSRQAVKAFVEDALPKATCRQDGRGAEDVEIGKCLEQVGVKAIDSRDNFGRHRFFPLPPAYHLVPRSLPDDNWFWRYIYYPMKGGFECCSDTTISFHYITPNDMYVLEFFIYHVQPYGVNHVLSGDTTQPYLLNFHPPSSPTTPGKPTLPASGKDITDNLIRKLINKVEGSC